MKSGGNAAVWTRRRELEVGVNETLRELAPLQERVLRLRYGIGNGGEVHGCEQVAGRLRMSDRRLRRIEEEALGRLWGFSIDTGSSR